MENQLNRELYELACDAHLCNEHRQAWGNKDKLALIQYYKDNPDWCLERQFPALKYMEDHFNNEEARDEGVFVSQNIDNLVLEDQVYIFVNCTGYAHVKFNPEKAIFPMIYLSQGSKMSFIVDGSSSPFQLYDNSQVKIDVVNGGKFKIYKCESA